MSPGKMANSTSKAKAATYLMVSLKLLTPLRQAAEHHPNDPAYPQLFR
jgi:hypothetical protein